jgi:hypothetical protein
MRVSLAEIQRQMSAGLLHHKNDGIEQLFVKDDTDLQARLSVYRNNVFFGLTSALADLYSVVKQLVGEEFFSALAKRYIRLHPPEQAAMVFFGQDFPDFVAQDKACQDLPYLSDVARFELAKHRAYHAADAKSLTPQWLQQIEIEKLMTSVLELHPSLQILDSKWASRSIWQAHQAETPKFEGIDIHIAEQSVLVRPSYEVFVCRADAALLMLLQAIAQGVDLRKAIDQTLAAHPDFDLPQALAMGFGNGFFSGIHFT